MFGTIEAEQVAIEGIVVVAEECLLATIAALGDVVGDARDNNAGEAGIWGMVTGRRRGVN